MHKSNNGYRGIQDGGSQLIRRRVFRTHVIVLRCDPMWFEQLKLVKQGGLVGHEGENNNMVIDVLVGSEEFFAMTDDY